MDKGWVDLHFTTFCIILPNFPIKSHLPKLSRIWQTAKLIKIKVNPNQGPRGDELPGPCFTEVTVLVSNTFKRWEIYLRVSVRSSLAKQVDAHACTICRRRRRPPSASLIRPNLDLINYSPTSDGRTEGRSVGPFLMRGTSVVGVRA